MDTKLPSIVGPGALQELVALACTCPPGCFVEVGVYKGGSAQVLLESAKEQGREMFAYDTFTGIPYQGPDDAHKVGDFNDTSYESVKQGLPGATVVKGVFPESAVPMPPVAFVHLDCDQYQSIKDSVNYLLPLMVDGGIFWFDDYGCLPGANKAVDELFEGKLERAACYKFFVRIDKKKES